MVAEEAMHGGLETPLRHVGGPARAEDCLVGLGSPRRLGRVREPDGEATFGSTGDSVLRARSR